MQLINEAFSVAKEFANQTSNSVKDNANHRIDNIKQQLISQINQILKINADENVAKIKQIFEDNVPMGAEAINEKMQNKVDEAMDSLNDTIRDVINQSCNINADFVFFNFTMLDIILASSAATLALIAVVNSACLFKLASMVRSRHNRQRNSKSYNDLELSPIIKKNLKFGKNKVIRSFNIIHRLTLSNLRNPPSEKAILEPEQLLLVSNFSIIFF